MEGAFLNARASLSQLPQWWWDNVRENPGHVVVETFLVLFVAYILLLKKTLNTTGPAVTSSLTKKEVDELIADWEPEPLVPPMSEEDQGQLAAAPVVTKAEGSLLYLQGYNKPALNFATFDFLGFGQLKLLKDAALTALDRYGCGSCGPRGFYGTSQEHLLLEDEIASFMEADGAISYSDSATTVSSCIPAFAKKGDLVVFDVGVEEPMQNGLNLSRSILRPFKHNDMEDLERVLREIDGEDRRFKRSAADQRRFIAVEGLYRNYGDICPLPRLIELKKKYNYRLVLNEAYSFGTLGRTGKGVSEHFDVSRRDVDILTVSMAHTLASIGGLCVGNAEVVDHQRLSGAGYCFSAAAPPFVNASAVAALREMQEHPELLEQLRDRAQGLRDRLQKRVRGMRVVSCELSPIIHLAFEGKEWEGEDSEARARVLVHELAEECWTEGLAVAPSRSMAGEKYPPPPHLRITVNSRHTNAELDECTKIVAAQAKRVLSRHKK
jgi:serine palmitoyltransferase